MVSDLDDIDWPHAWHEHGLRLILDVSGEQEAMLSVIDSEHEALLIDASTALLRGPSVEGVEQGSPLQLLGVCGCPQLDSLLVSGVPQVLEVVFPVFRRPRHPELSDGEVLDHGHQPAHVIGMGVREKDGIDVPDAAPAEVVQQAH